MCSSYDYVFTCQTSFYNMDVHIGLLIPLDKVVHLYSIVTGVS